MAALHDEFDGKELDFWLGEWDATWDGGRGTNRISRILRGRVILEEFAETSAAETGGSDGPEAGAQALTGRSWSVFDPGLGLWRQTWVDDQGGYFDLVGERVEGWFAFSRAAPERGPAFRQRMIFRDIEPHAFRWLWQASTDDGATWVTRWEIHYTRRSAVEPRSRA